jgi:MFS transporter, CP family, cyanate transporter
MDNGGTARSRGAALLFVVAVVAVALNQRPAVVSVAPVLGDLRTGTGLSSAMAGLLTTLPVLCFGAFAPVAPRLARRIGLELAVAASLVLLAAGIALRVLPPVALLYAGSVLAAYLVGLGGLLLAPGSGTLVWVCAFGLAQGSGFALALSLIVLRSPTPQAAARLGGVAQCLGYLMAAAGPLVLGWLHDRTGAWAWPMVLLLVLLVPMAWAGWGAARSAVLRVGERSREPSPA